jgi:hypothetical protein
MDTCIHVATATAIFTFINPSTNVQMESFSNLETNQPMVANAIVTLGAGISLGSKIKCQM